MDFPANFIDEDRARAIEQMMQSSQEFWWDLKSKNLGKTCVKYTKHFFEAYEHAKHVWSALELSQEAQELFQDIINSLGSVERWHQKAGWTSDPNKQISTNEDASLLYLAPLQRNLASVAKEDIQKDIIKKMNCILENTLSITGISIDGSINIPEEVLTPLKDLINVSDFTYVVFIKLTN